MKSEWHEQIQRYVNGQSNEEEAAALQAELNEDAELRALYLDYMNLDAALGAAAEMATIDENGTGRTAAFPQAPARLTPRSWRWLAAAAACVALLVGVVLPGNRRTSQVRPEVAATISSTQSAIARLSVEPAPAFPSWMSPTASLLDQPALPQ